jgi:hypothetical protein
MSEEVTETAMQERIALIAAAARVPLTPESRVRIGRAVAPTLSRFAAAAATLTFEIEPSSVTVIARGEIHI